jgi:hypothetical protein
MTSQAVFPGLRDLAELVFTRRAGSRAGEAASGGMPDDRRAECDFIRDIIAERPQAFSGEQDVLSMMCLFPGRF